MTALRVGRCVAIAVSLAACSTSSYVASADDEVEAVLGAATASTLAEREAWVVRPENEPLPVRPDATPPAAPREPAPAARAPEVYDLARTLATAVRQNRDFLSRREGLYQSGLSISLVRFQFGPQFAAAVSYLWPRREGGPDAHSLDASFSASQILPTGGTLALSSGVGADWSFGQGAADPVYGTSAAVTLTQPLLRGAGHDISHEALTQAERELVYSIRDFELFREAFSIQIAQRYFELTSQKKTLANEDRNYESAVFDRGKAEALQRVGRNAEQEVFRARRREIEAKDQLINAKAAYDRAVDEFKILLGIPTTTAIDLAESSPPYEPVRFDVASAVAAARHNRLSLITERQRVEDTERALRIAENALLPDLALTASYGVAGSADDSRGVLLGAPVTHGDQEIDHQLLEERRRGAAHAVQ